MELVKRLPTMKDAKGHFVSYGIFVCPICGQEVRKELQQGKRQETCSRRCGGVWAQTVIGKSERRYIKRIQLEECKGCDYYRQFSGADKGCTYCLETGESVRSKTAAYTKSCKEAGIYVPKTRHRRAPKPIKFI